MKNLIILSLAAVAFFLSGCGSNSKNSGVIPGGKSGCFYSQMESSQLQAVLLHAQGLVKGSGFSEVAAQCPNTTAMAAGAFVQAALEKGVPYNLVEQIVMENQLWIAIEPLMSTEGCSMAIVDQETLKKIHTCEDLNEK